MLTAKEYESRIRQLKENRILLDQNPIDRGLPYMISKISEVQEAKNSIISLLVEAMGNKTECEIALENLEMEHKMEYQGILANDPEVKAQKTSDLRSSLANVKLAELALRVHHAKIASFISDGFLSVIKYFYENTQKISDSLDQQISLVKLYYEQTNKQSNIKEEK